MIRPVNIVAEATGCPLTPTTAQNTDPVTSSNACEKCSADHVPRVTKSARTRELQPKPGAMNDVSLAKIATPVPLLTALADYQPVNHEISYINFSFENICNNLAGRVKTQMTDVRM